MSRLGYLLIAAGFLGGSYFSVVQKEGVPWVSLVISLLAGAVGIFLVRQTQRASAHSEDRLTTNLGSIASSLESLAAKATRLNNEKDSMNPYDVHSRIDADFMEDLDTFVEARESLSHRYGVQAYANLMTAFATGERYLNRAWSASVDGWVDEVSDSLGKAERQFQDALAQFRALTTET